MLDDDQEQEAERRWFAQGEADYFRFAKADSEAFELETADAVQLWIAVSRLRRWARELARLNDEQHPGQPWRSDWLTGQEMMLGYLLHSTLTPQLVRAMAIGVEQTARPTACLGYRKDSR